MQYIYGYINKDNFINAKKYGIKLSENIDKTITVENTTKSGILAFLSPKDSPLYKSKLHVCIKISLKRNKCICL